MSFTREQNVGVKQSPPPVIEHEQSGGPLTNVSSGGGAPYSRPRTVPARSRLERFGFWVIVAAAAALLLLLLGVILPPVLGGFITGAYMGLFVGGLTLMNLPRPSGWANTVLGRKVFPVLNAVDTDVWRLAGVNAGMAFAFAFFFSVVAHFLGSFLAGILVFGGLIAAGIFYNRARKVIIRP
jgi:hypothetical protein